MNMQLILEAACWEKSKELCKEGYSEIYIEMFIEIFEIGFKKGFEREMLRCLKALQDNGLSFEDACSMLKLTEEEIEICKDSLKEGMQTD